jgi:hypothetical protein
MTNESDRELTTADVAYGKDREGGTEGTVREVRRPEMESDGQGEPLLPSEASSSYREQWDVIQTRFVDEPRQSVQQADALVAEVIQQLAQKFADARQNLEGQWDRGDDVSTEDLRVALQQYRTFFRRLLSA